MAHKKDTTIWAEAFSVKSYMKNSVVMALPPAGPCNREPPSPDGVPSTFRRLCDGGDLPVSLVHKNNGNHIRWKVPLESLDYQHYLPLFFHGLSETTYPYEFLARLGLHEMLEHGDGKILPAVDLLIVPIRSGLNTRIPLVLCNMMKALQRLVVSEQRVGEALVPFFRQILPIFRIFKNKNTNIGDSIDYSQQKRMNIADLIQETLELFEVHGGKNAFINIKYMVPTYESCVLNWPHRAFTKPAVN